MIKEIGHWLYAESSVSLNANASMTGQTNPIYGR